MIKALLSTAAAMTLGVSAQAATIYASAIDWENNGTVGSSNGRNIETNALGAPDGSFLSLGLTNSDGSNPGFAVFAFADLILGASEASVWEVTFNCSPRQDGACTYPESVEVWFGDDYDFGSHDFSDLSDFTLAGELFNADSQSGESLTIGVGFTYLALVDTSARNFPGGPSVDGFDVDAVGVRLVGGDIMDPVPLPAAAFLFLPALAAGMLRKRRA